MRRGGASSRPHRGTSEQAGGRRQGEPSALPSLFTSHVINLCSSALVPREGFRLLILGCSAVPSNAIAATAPRAIERSPRRHGARLISRPGLQPISLPHPSYS